MKKPTLRLRQVFEGPTHFKVVKPLGNPIKIAKKGLSPSLMGRLRKYAEGTPDEPVQPPTDEEVAIADQMKAQAYVPAGSDIPVSAGEGSFGVPALEPAPVASVVGASVPDLELPEPAPVAPVTAPVVAAPVTPVVAPAAAPAAPVVVVQAAQPAPVAAPEPPKPTAEEVRQQRVDAYMAAFEEQEAKRVADQAAVTEKLFQLNQQANDVASSAIGRARAEYDKRQRQLTEFDRPKEMTGTDIARSIGSALSVALGAFASGMTGVPNFALKIYEDALARDLAKQRQQRDSILKQMEIAGLSVEDAEKLYRAQKDKEFATRLDLAAQSTTNPKAREEARKAAFQFAQKAAVDEADIQKKVAESFKATKQGELAVEQAAVVKPEQKTKEAREERENLKLYFDQLDKLLDRQQRGEISRNELDVERLKIKKTFDAAMASLSAKGKEGQLPAGVEGMTEYDKLKEAFKSEGTKGLAKQVAQTFSVDGVKLLARSEADRNAQQTFWKGFSSSEKAINDLVKEVNSMKAWDSMLPTQRAARVESLAAKFAVGYPKSEGFQRALSVADKDVVVDKILQDPTSFRSWFLGLSSASINALKQAMEEEKVEALKDSVVDGDPNLNKLIAPTKEKKYGAMSENDVANR